jgi:hypothetical protein
MKLPGSMKGANSLSSFSCTLTGQPSINILQFLAASSGLAVANVYLPYVTLLGSLRYRPSTWPVENTSGLRV